MCGIFGYVGRETDLGDRILAALKLLEYRGYDSWGVGIAVDGMIDVQKQPGKIATAQVDFPPADIGFGHTRWATHDGVTQANAHPHLGESGKLAVIHNGIVENFRALRDELESEGRVFQSETDTEVIAHLIELAKDMRAAHRRGEALGLSEDELAFYDALEVNDSAVKVLGDETLRAIARELVESVRRNVSIDWAVKESARAKLRTIVKRLLRKHGYPPDKQEKATQIVLEQAEQLCKGWAA